jgi:hypothetical protein
VEGLEEKINLWRVLVRKSGGNRLGLPRREWENNLKRDLKQTGC